MEKKHRKFTASEDRFQEAIARYLDSRRVLWCHVANERKTSRIQGAKLKRQGVKSGVPDIIVFEPRGNYCGLAIELKVGSNKTTESQKNWLKRLKNANWKTLVSYSLDEVIEVVDNYLKQKPPQSIKTEEEANKR